VVPAMANPWRRMEVPVLNDAEPLMQQLLPYFLQRQDLFNRGETISAPLELLGPGDFQGGRPVSPDDAEQLRRAIEMLQSGMGSVG